MKTSTSFTRFLWLATSAAGKPLHGRGDTNASTELRARAVEDNAGYGLAHLSELQKFTQTAPNDDKYHFLANSGKGVDVYVVDTGVTEDPSFDDRVVGEWNHVESDIDDNEAPRHGYKVASLLGSNRYGSAKKPTIRSYKINKGKHGLPDQELGERAVKRIVDVDAQRRKKKEYKGAVLNLSFGLDDTKALIDAVNAAWNQGIVVVTAAGDMHVDASRHYPCGSPNAICVSSSTKDYKQYYNSGFGPAVAILAPGEHILGYQGGGVSLEYTGTSYSAAYVSGIIATYLSFYDGDLTPDQVKALLLKNAERGVLDQTTLNGSPNLLANNGYQKAGSNDRLPFLGAQNPPQGSPPRKFLPGLPPLPPPGPPAQATDGGPYTTMSSLTFSTTAKNVSSVPCTVSDQTATGQLYDGGVCFVQDGAGAATGYAFGMPNTASPSATGMSSGVTSN